MALWEAGANPAYGYSGKIRFLLGENKQLSLALCLLPP